MQQESNPILVQTYRADVLESFHRGVVCVVDAKGDVVLSVGNVEQIAYPRSAMKFFQQLPLLVRGGKEKFGISQEEMAVLCGSHNGEQRHIEVVKQLLAKGGYSEKDLMCGAQQPTLGKDKVALIKADSKPSPLHNNCSGKHAGFLLLCKLMGCDPVNYISPNHPIQREIAQYVSLFYEVPLEEMKVGVDGCSAPIMAFSVRQMAVAYKNLVHPVSFNDKVQNACKELLDAVNVYPNMIAGTGRYCTELLEESKGAFVGKTGADGVFCLGHKAQKLGVAIKIDDGKMGPQYTVAQAFVEQNQWIKESQSEKLHKYVSAEQINFAGNVTGLQTIPLDVNLQYYK